MKLRIHLLPLLSLSLLLLVVPPGRAQTAEDFFHGGAMFYLSNNIPSAKQVVTNGLQQFPDDAKLKKLWELLNQQQQSQSQQQQQQNEQKQDEKKQDEKKQDEEKQQQQDQKPQPSKGDQKKQDEEMKAHAMTPQEAKQLLDAQKGEEQVLQFRPQEPKNRGKTLKDW
jgi:Ca-activated chloride channel family protein